MINVFVVFIYFSNGATHKKVNKMYHNKWGKSSGIEISQDISLKFIHIVSIGKITHHLFFLSKICEMPTVCVFKRNHWFCYNISFFIHWLIGCMISFFIHWPQDILQSLFTLIIQHASIFSLSSKEEDHLFIVCEK